MAQLLQSHPPVTSFGTEEFLAGISTGSNAGLPAQHLSIQPGVMPGARQDIVDTKELQAELEEHRYNLERKVEQRTERLVKHIALLESCNATLCDKLSQARNEIAALRKQLAAVLSETVLPGSGTADGYGQPAPVGM